jgi:hypothetical protein
MSIRITSYHYRDESDFLGVNPWFALAIERRLNEVYDNHRLHSAIRDEMNNQFPVLFRNQALSSSEWAQLTSKLDAHTATGISQINAATERKVTALVNDDAKFGELRQDIQVAAIQRIDTLHRSSDEDYKRRLRELESSNESIKSGQIWTFLGGFAFGVAAVLFRK